MADFVQGFVRLKSLTRAARLARGSEIRGKDAGRDAYALYACVVAFVARTEARSRGEVLDRALGERELTLGGPICFFHERSSRRDLKSDRQQC